MPRPDCTQMIQKHKQGRYTLYKFVCWKLSNLDPFNVPPHLNLTIGVTSGRTFDDRSKVATASLFTHTILI